MEYTFFRYKEKCPRAEKGDQGGMEGTFLGAFLSDKPYDAQDAQLATTLTTEKLSPAGFKPAAGAAPAATSNHHSLRPHAGA